MAAKSKAQLAHERDAEIIADHMRQVAEDNSFCDLYYDEIDKLNEKLSVKLPSIRPSKHGVLSFVVRFDNAEVKGNLLHTKYDDELTVDGATLVQQEIEKALADHPFKDLFESWGNVEVEDIAFNES